MDDTGGYAWHMVALLTCTLGGHLRRCRALAQRRYSGTGPAVRADAARRLHQSLAVAARAHRSLRIAAHVAARDAHHLRFGARFWDDHLADSSLHRALGDQHRRDRADTGEQRCLRSGWRRRAHRRARLARVRYGVHPGLSRLAGHRIRNCWRHLARAQPAQDRPHRSLSLLNGHHPWTFAELGEGQRVVSGCILSLTSAPTPRSITYAPGSASPSTATACRHAFSLPSVTAASQVYCRCFACRAPAKPT